MRLLASGVLLGVVSLLGGMLVEFVSAGPARAEQAEGAVVASPDADGLFREAHAVFAERCFECHGLNLQSGGLRLDAKAPALRGGDSGPVIIPGDSGASRLIEAVTGADEALGRMPPVGEPLSGGQIAALRAWIDGGAPWPERGAAEADVPRASHWAFNPPQRPAVPEVSRPEWVRNPIDAFVLARLDREGLGPSPEADRHTLVRRLHLDLIGLPPTPEEVEAFVRDASPNAYERLVNRLLASPHFGERWARKWLDLARYADSDGYEKDNVRPHAWRYRHWLIEALNRDLPYDQFVIEQLAGDLLPNAALDQRIATGFHRNTLTNTEGGVDQEEYRVAQVVDRTNTTGAVFLGLTMACAQCHTHKYDPITQREYFGMYAFFNTGKEQNIPAPLDGELLAYKRAKAAFDVEYARVKRETVDARRAELAELLPDWEREQNLAAPEWETLEPVTYLSAGGAALTLEGNGLLRAEGNSPSRDRYTVVANTPQIGYTGFRIEALPHEDLPGGGPGRARNGAYTITGFSVDQVRINDAFVSRPVALEAAWADAALDGYPLANALDGKADTGWAAGGDGQPHTAVFIAERDAGFSEGSAFTFTIEQRRSGSYSLGAFRLLATRSPRDRLRLPDPVRDILLTQADQRTDAQRERLLDYFASQDPLMQAHLARLEGLRRAEPQPPDTLAQVLIENPEPPETFVHIRGNFLEPGEKVEPHTPAVLNAFKPVNGEPNRLDLAQWIVSRDNPLTARVQVNRIWEQLFGQGIVETSEDFGTQGKPPTHPELLDWLAVEFMDRGWSTKEMIRLVVQSSAYRQASRIRPELRELDPENKLLARQNRFRHDAEIIRDAALAVSGLLNPAVGGPSVRPPLPPGVAELGYANSVRWPESDGEDQYRRGLYIFFQRTVPYPMLMTFDCPDSNVSAARRMRSNTPLQALTVLNSPGFHECAQAFGREIAAGMTGGPDERIREAFVRSLAREPEPSELASLRALYDEQVARYEHAPEEAEALAGPYLPEGAQSAEAAASIAVARVLMNLDEFLTRE